MSKLHAVHPLLIAIACVASLSVSTRLVAQQSDAAATVKNQSSDVDTPSDDASDPSRDASDPARDALDPADDGLDPASEVKAEPTAAAPVAPAKASPTSATPSVRPLSVTVALVSEREIEGTLTDTTQLQMQTSFGTVSIPLSEVAGVRFASADDATTTVVMLNGDSITGATDVKLITVETEWGSASINGPSIASIMFVPGLKWSSQSGLNGNRWSLSDSTARQSPAPGSAAPAAGSGAGTLPPPAQTAPQRNQGFSSPPSIPRNDGQPFFPNR